MQFDLNTIIQHVTSLDDWGASVSLHVLQESPVRYVLAHDVTTDNEHGITTAVFRVQEEIGTKTLYDLVAPGTIIFDDERQLPFEVQWQSVPNAGVTVTFIALENPTVTINGTNQTLRST